MIGKFAALHRFLKRHLFYPIFLSSLLAVGIYVGRVVLSQNWVVYRNLAWNLFLAWLPYFFCLLAAWLHARYPRRWWLLVLPGLLWLIFFPNAPYLITDFLHLEQRPYIPIWYDIILLATFAWTGIFLGIASLWIMQRIVKSYLGQWISWIFVMFAIALSGLGVYLGRFSRWNSWDMLIQPKLILAEVVSKMTDPLNNLRFLGFTMLFVAFLTVSYLMFVSMNHANDEEMRD